MEKNESNKKPNGLKNRKVLLSTLWLFAILNYLLIAPDFLVRGATSGGLCRSEP
jgi:hypothetical protein